MFRLVKAILILALAALMSAGCARRNSAASAAQQTTQTIAPAEGQPAPNGSDTMTQTVEVDDSRSESDGMTGTATGPTKAPAKTTKAPAKKKVKK